MPKQARDKGPGKHDENKAVVVPGKGDSGASSESVGRIGQVQRLQRLAGNRAVAANLPVQRHPVGAPMLTNSVAAEPLLKKPGEAPAQNRGRSASAPPVLGGGGVAAPAAPAPAGPAPAGPTPAPAGPTPAPAGPTPAPAGPTPAPAGPTPAPAGPTPAPAGPTPAPAGPTPAPAGPTPAPAGPTPAPSGPAPAPVLGPTLQVAFAQNALQAAFGGAAGRNIVPGQITVVSGHAAVCAAYDTYCVANNVFNSYFNRAWQMGDKLAEDTATGMRLNAFAEPSPSTRITIDGTTTDPTATVHEMLHINTHADFRGEVGEVMNEGATQRFAVAAVRASGNSVAGSENTYTQEQQFVNALVGVVGEAALLDGYFNGPRNLIDVANQMLGPGIFHVAKGALSTSPPGYAVATPLMAPQSVNQKIAAIRQLLRGWVGERDLHIIDLLVRGVSASDKATIRAQVGPLMNSGLWRSSTKRQLRAILGMPA